MGCERGRKRFIIEYPIAKHNQEWMIAIYEDWGPYGKCLFNETDTTSQQTYRQRQMKSPSEEILLLYYKSTKLLMRSLNSYYTRQGDTIKLS